MQELLNKTTVQEPTTEDVDKLTTLILTKNNFSFNNEHYLQVKGTTMGTCMALLYAYILMDNLERRMLAKMHAVPSIWWRYIDDVFASWPHGEKQLVEFLNKRKPI